MSTTQCPGSLQGEKGVIDSLKYRVKNLPYMYMYALQAVTFVSISRVQVQRISHNIHIHNKPSRSSLGALRREERYATLADNDHYLKQLSRGGAKSVHAIYLNWQERQMLNNAVTG